MQEPRIMRDIRSIGISAMAVAVNAVAFYKFGISIWLIPVLMTTVLLALEATPDPS
jgi:hypothetical protein